MRPNLSHVAGIICQFMQKHKKCHLDVARHVLQYVKRALGIGQVYKSNGHIKVEAYIDVDYGGNIDDKKSISRFGTYLGGNLMT